MNSVPDKNDEELPGMLAVAKGIAEQRWPHTMDAAVWAAEFMKIHAGMHDLDEGTMLSWFANAIMAGYDTAQARAASSAIEPTFAAAALRFVKAHIESDRLDRHDDVEQVDDEVYDKADAEYNESKTAMVRAYKAMASTDGGSHG